MSNNSILIIEDEEDILELLKFRFENEDFQVFIAKNSTQAFSVLYDETIDLVICDIMLPGLQGTDISKKMKKDERLSNIPIIFLTAKNTEEDMLRGFQAGGDDYLTKPFSFKILLARVAALLNRAYGSHAPYRIAQFEIHPERHQVKIDGRRISLTPREFNVLQILIEKKNKTVTRETLLEKGWGMNTKSSYRAVDIVITRLRNKIKPYGYCIETITGFGYQWNEEKMEQNPSVASYN